MRLLVALLWMLPVLGGCFADSSSPVSQLYGGCFSVDDCDLRADTCFEIVEEDHGGVGRMCTNFCDLQAKDPDASCLEGGVCYATEPATWGVCFARCVDVDGLPNDRLCAPSSVCIEAIRDDGLTDFICWPLYFD
jgi:hypothetical protein